MRILHLSQPDSEGTAVVVRQLARAGRADGAEVTVGTSIDGDLSTWLSGDGIPVLPVPMNRQPKLSDVFIVFRLMKVFRDYDLIHLHSSKAGAVGRVAAFLMRRPPAIVFTPHGWSWYIGGKMSRVYRRFERWAVKQTNAIVVVSQTELNDGLAALGPEAPLRLIENGVDLEKFSPPDAPRDDSLVVCVGRMSVQKGQDRLIRAAATLGNPRIRFALIGDGPDRANLEKLTQDLGVSQQFTFVGKADPRPYLQSATVVVIPSRWEGLSIAMLEAMATANAIIYTDVGGSNALNGVGIRADGETEEQILSALAASIEHVIADPDAALLWGRRARQRVEAEYSETRVGNEYSILWRELVSKRR